MEEFSGHGMLGVMRVWLMRQTEQWDMPSKVNFLSRWQDSLKIQLHLSRVCSLFILWSVLEWQVTKIFSKTSTQESYFSDTYFFSSPLQQGYLDFCFSSEEQFKRQVIVNE